MIICEYEQGSPGWHQDRAGVITGSMYKIARAKLKTGKNKGDYTKAGHDYAFKLAVERISGQPLDVDMYENWYMRRGKELEPEARFAHELRHDVTVDEAGLIMTDDRLFGISADGLIGEDGGSEYKCLLSPENIAKVILEQDITDYIDQVQGAMWITGRKWWHYGMYAPFLASINKDLIIHEVERDEEFIGELEADLVKFNMLVEQYKNRIAESPSFIKTIK